MTKPAAVSAAFLVAVNAVVTLLASLGTIHWSDAQTAVVYAEANVGAALVLALYFHFAPDSKKQPVAIQGAVIAFATTTVGLAAAFQWVHLTDAQIATAGGAITAVVALIATAFARNAVVAPVTPPVAQDPVNPPGGNVAQPVEPNPPVPGR